MAPVLQCRHVQFAGSRCLIDIPSLDLNSGEVIQCHGTSTSGVPDAYVLLSGLADAYSRTAPAEQDKVVREAAPLHEVLRGSISLNNKRMYEDLSPKERAELIGRIYEDPGLAIIGDTVLEDFRFTFAALEREPLHPQVLDRYGLYRNNKLDRRSEHLSGGERQRLNCANALEIGPRLLVADFTNANLDKSFMVSMKEWISDLAAQGGAAIVFGLRPNELAGARQCYLNEGRLEIGDAPSNLFPGIIDEVTSLEALYNRSPRGDDIVLMADNIRRPGIIDPATFSVRAREIFLISGPNGAGKTTVGRILTGRYQKEHEYLGDYRLAGSVRPAMSPQYPERSFLMRTVEEEVRGILTEEVLAVCNIEPRDLRLEPRALDRSRQKLLSIALTLQLSSGVAILDEPTCGLDSNSKLHFIRLLNSYQQLAIVIITHDPSLMQLGKRLGWGATEMGG